MLKYIFLFLMAIFALILINFAYSDNPYEYGKVWNEWSDYTRYVYLWGFEDGEQMFGSSAIVMLNGIYYDLDDSEAMKKIKNKLDLQEIRDLFLLSRSEIKLENIRDIITDYYDDPANIYIDFPIMIKLAKEKLNGVSEDSLKSEIEKYRRFVIERQKIMKQD